MNVLRTLHTTVNRRRLIMPTFPLLPREYGIMNLLNSVVIQIHYARVNRWMALSAHMRGLVSQCDIVFTINPSDHLPKRPHEWLLESGTIRMWIACVTSPAPGIAGGAAMDNPTSKARPEPYLHGKAMSITINNVVITYRRGSTFQSGSSVKFILSIYKHYLERVPRSTACLNNTLRPVCPPQPRRTAGDAAQQPRWTG